MTNSKEKELVPCPYCRAGKVLFTTELGSMDCPTCDGKNAIDSFMAKFIPDFEEMTKRD